LILRYRTVDTGEKVTLSSMLFR